MPAEDEQVSRVLTSCTNRRFAVLMRSLAATSTRFPLNMNETEFICDIMAPRGH